MSDISETIDTLVNKTPEPVAKEYTKTLTSIGKTINLVLEPFVGLVWGYEKIKQLIKDRLSKKLVNVPTNEIITPNPIIAGPTIEALRFSANESTLSELYTNLLASSMDKETIKFAHPSFVEIIKQLCPDEAKILHYLHTAHIAPLIIIYWPHDPKVGGITWRYISDIAAKADCENHDFFMSYIENLKRLGIIEIPENISLNQDKTTKKMLDAPKVKQEMEKLDKEKGSHIIYFKLIKLTEYGTQFVNACVIEHDLFRKKIQI